MITETSTHELAHTIRQLSAMESNIAARVMSSTGIDVSAFGKCIPSDRSVAEGRIGHHTLISITEMRTDREAMSLYGSNFAVRLPVGSARHRDRDCAAALAILGHAGRRR